MGIVLVGKEKDRDYAKLLHMPGSGSLFRACMICSARSRPRPSPSRGSASSSALSSTIVFGSSGRGSLGATLDRSGLVEFLDAKGGSIDTGNDRAISSGGSYEVQPRHFSVNANLGDGDREHSPISSFIDAVSLSVEFLEVDTCLVSSPMTILSAFPLSLSHMPR